MCPRKVLTCLAIFGLLASAAPALAGDEIIVAVFLMEAKTSGLDAAEVGNLTDYMATMIGQDDRIQVIPRDEIRKRLVQAKADSHKECYDTNCQIELGRELAAQYSISSKIGKVGNKCLLSAQVYDLRKAAMVKGTTQKTDCNPDNLIAAVETIARDLTKVMVGGSPNKIADNKPPPDPVIEPPPQPKPQPQPRPQPRTEVRTASKAKKLPSSFFTVGVGVNNMHFVDKDEVDPETLAGLELALDFRLGGDFSLGIVTDFEFYEHSEDYFYDAFSIRFGYFDLSMRLGYMIALLDNALIIYPYGDFGFAALVVVDDGGTGYDPDPMLSAIAGFGCGVRYMFLPWLGVSADLGIDYNYWFEGEDPDYTILTDEGTVSVNFQIGAIFGF
ncbi:MAG: hypothetical protein JXR96_06625 [Deltaproteobacteria bacterium]|nr:hypothetical protein [Deltaproteobacteria bacterium]